MTITRVAQARWEAVADAAFDSLAAAMPADLPAPLHTLVGEDDHLHPLVGEDDPDTAARRERFGFTAGRREGAYDLPTDPRVSGLGSARPPAGVKVLPAGAADEGIPRAAPDRAIRDEAGATMGPHTPGPPAGPPGDTLGDPSAYAVAVREDDGAYVGLVRAARVRRRAGVGLNAVRPDRRRQGVGRALPAHAPERPHRDGIAYAWAEVDDSDAPARAPARSAGARRATGCLEPVRR
ncbi:GNAT family N-acetyltransferase [Streptomyces abyssomicinicus]|uniref:GNAT family N-acetyltransferase n=1 Tax=Streptomyces abyssomicinicus TaxID=574929 RepID=UPI001FED294F|nr:GNAT family N-acetyltransferase [Streptomyces abyssomicinicus]